MVLVQLALVFVGVGMLLLALLIVGALWPHRLLALGMLGGLFVAMGPGPPGSPRTKCEPGRGFSRQAWASYRRIGSTSTREAS